MPARLSMADMASEMRVKDVDEEDADKIVSPSFTSETEICRSWD